MSSRRPRMLMPVVVLGLLGGHMLFIVIAITLGTGDPSFAVVPEYYERAVDYDNRKALLAQSKAMGWSVELLPGDQADVMGLRDLVVQLCDDQGLPIQGLAVKVEAFHLARASEPVAMDCVEVLPGQYLGTGRLLREGFWQFAIDASSDGRRFILDRKQFVRSVEASR